MPDDDSSPDQSVRGLFVESSVEEGMRVIF